LSHFQGESDDLKCHSRPAEIRRGLDTFAWAGEGIKGLRAYLTGTVVFDSVK
jgi:hypothetical protein